MQNNYPPASTSSERRPRISLERLEAFADGLGIDHIGMAPVQPPVRDFSYEDWVKLGYHGTMAWMERNIDVRRDPGIRFPWARSVVVCGMHYQHPLPESIGPEHLLHGVARYARGRDYHIVFLKRLKKLAKAIGAEVNANDGEPFQARPYVDTGPFLEREYFASAGLGWIGKHTLAITQKKGSWFFIGLLFTNLELREPVRVQPDRCGTCTRCIDACPTDAILEPYRLDARRCLSYLTIEHKGNIPDEYAGEQGKWVFGCDICQEVCPWNWKVDEVGDEAYAPREDLVGLTKAEVIEMEEEEFRERFAGSPIKRPGVGGMRRNLTQSRKDAKK